LKSADFFDVENHAQLTFSGKSIQKLDGNQFKITGDLTIKGETKEVVLDTEYSGLMKDPWRNIKAGLSMSGKINRKDFGLTWNAALETGGVLVGEEVKLVAEIQLIKQ
jgi:polyisoprenoid-binding protein YceI